MSMTNEEFIDEIYHVAFGASETRHEHTHEEVHARLLEISNQHYERTCFWKKFIGEQLIRETSDEEER